MDLRHNSCFSFQGSDFEITTCSQEPSGFVESKLTKKNMQLSDRGTYTCRDSDNIHSFSIWVTALKSKLLFAQLI